MSDVSIRQRRRLLVLHYYTVYVETLRSELADFNDETVQASRRALASTLESACLHDPELLEDFRLAFAAPRRA